ncbi:Proline--tRNA ligase, partial [Frankliniella fusca]
PAASNSAGAQSLPPPPPLLQEPPPPLQPLPSPLLQEPASAHLHEPAQDQLLGTAGADLDDQDDQYVELGPCDVGGRYQEAMDAFNAVGDGLVVVDEYTGDLLGEYVNHLPVKHVMQFSHYSGLPMIFTNPNVTSENWMIIGLHHHSKEQLDDAVHQIQEETGIYLL